MFYSTLNAVLNLDLAWFVWLFQANLHWLFILICVVMFFQKKKNVLIGLVFLTLMLYAVSEMIHVALMWTMPSLAVGIFVVQAIFTDTYSNRFIEKNSLLISMGGFLITVAILNIL